MKKLLITSSLIGLFVLFSNSLSAQVSEKIALKIDTDTKIAITTIKNNKSLKDAEKEKFILRIEAFVKAAKKRDDAKAMEVFKTEYKRIADNYLRVTGKTLPTLSPIKKEN